MKTAYRLLKKAKKYYFIIIITIISLICAAALNIVTPEVVRRFTALIQVPENIKMNTLLTYSLILIGAYFLRAVFKFLSLWLAHVAAWNFVGDITLELYTKLQELSLSYFSSVQTGELLSKLINDSRMLETLIAHAVPDLISNIAIIICVTVMIFSINPTLALITLIPVPIVILVSSQFSKRVAPLFKINQKVLGKLTGMLQDKLSGIKEIQAFGKEDIEHAKVAEMCRHYSNVNIHANFANGIFNPSVEFFTSLGTVVVLGFGGVLITHVNLTTSDIVGFFMYLSLFYQPLAVLARIVEDVQSAIAGGERVLEILDTDPKVKDAPNAEDIGICDGNISVNHVSFSYNADETILNDVSFEAKQGQMIALVGATGVGKSTIISLIERFYVPDSGEIMLDGKNIDSITMKSLRKNISIVLQDVFLFNGTIFDNIAYGSTEDIGSVTREQVIEAAKIACADGFISEMPDGYDTMIGERGVRLSGGQKQRIAIARAVLRNTPILILDEATSAVDTETEAQIQTAIENLAGERTIIVIAHRLSTVMKADNIIVLEKGKVAESGTHEELQNLGGIYSKLCNVQHNKLQIS